MKSKKQLKKVVCGALSAALLGGGLLLAQPAEAANGTAVTFYLGRTDAVVDGAKQVLPKAPKVTAGRTFIPLRATVEAFGFKVAYHPEDRTITIENKDRRLEMSVDMTYYRNNGQVAFMDVAPYVTEDGHTMVPIRFVADAMGFTTSVSGVKDKQVIEIKG